MPNPAANLEWDGGDEGEEIAAPPLAAPQVRPDGQPLKLTPTSAAPSPQIAAAVAATQFPNDIRKCYELLHQVNGMPTRSPAEIAARNAILFPLQAHIGRIQQGMPTLHKVDHTAFRGLHVAASSDSRLANLARTNLDVKRLLSERDVLKKSAEEFKSLAIERATQLAESEEKNKALAKENAELHELLKTAK